MDWLQVHSYDGKIVSSLLSSCSTVPLQEKREHADGLLLFLHDQSAISVLRHVIGDMGSRANFDTSNGINADDLLYICWEYRNNPTFIVALEEQLRDMESGMCPQGRTHRLWQLILAFGLCDFVN